MRIFRNHACSFSLDLPKVVSYAYAIILSDVCLASEETFLSASRQCFAARSEILCIFRVKDGLTTAKSDYRFIDLPGEGDGDGAGGRESSEWSISNRPRRTKRKGCRKTMALPTIEDELSLLV